MASLFDSLGFKCDECGDDGTDATQGYKVVEQRHLCPTCARNLAGAILENVSHGAIKWPCPQHKRKEVELLCCKCNVTVCHTCALTSHHGHQMQDIEKFFAEKRETVKKDVEEISAKQKETQIFLVKIEDLSQKMDGLVKDGTETISVTFREEFQGHKDRQAVEVSRINTEAEELIKQINEKRRMKLAAINEQYDNEHEKLMKLHGEVREELKVWSDNACRVSSDAKTSALAINAKLENAAKVAKSMIADDCDGKAFHARFAEFHEMGRPIEKLSRLDHDYQDKLTKVLENSIQRIDILIGKETPIVVKTIFTFLQTIKSYFV